MSKKNIERMVVIGGVAAGMSAASQAKRRQKDLEVIVLEKTGWVSYGACGMPYNIEDANRKIDDLVVISAERFRTERGIDVRTRTEAVEIDLAKHEVVSKRPDGQGRIGFDRLVIATGCAPIHPDLDGMDLPGVFQLHTLDQAASIKRWLNDPSLKRAVVVGGGHIGLEMVDVLTARGLAVTLLRRSPSVPSGAPREITAQVEAELNKYGVEVRTGQNVIGFEGQGKVQRVLTSSGPLDADIAIVATGVRPAVDLAQKAGIEIGSSGAIAVNDHMATSAPGVFAAGDCAEAYHLILHKGMFIPRGTTANKQGKIAGANAVGADEKFRGVMGTSVMRIFGLSVANTGITDAQAQEAGIEAQSVMIKSKTRAHAYPGAKDIMVRLLFQPAGGKLLGAYMVGGEGVAKRIDVIVTALAAGFTVQDLASLDLSYAPPFAPVWDPILVAANIAKKKVH